MLSRPDPACLVIADISGYTGYLAGVELDHAQDILADLIATVVSAFRPTFRLVKVEGDAAFVYSVAERIDASQLMDTVDRSYFAFRRRLRDIARASSCECNACIRIPALNLKVLAHHGVIGRQRIAGREELVGRDVILVHRLLKNGVEAAIGTRAYALYTEACVRATGVEPQGLGLLAHRETYEIIGAVDGWVRDLEAAWADEQQRAQNLVEAGSAISSLEFVLPGPPEIAWEWLTSPARRPQWQVGVTAVRSVSGEARRGPGTVNHCMHGRDAIVEEIVDWRPFDYFTIRSTLPIAGVPKLVMTEILEPIGDGTRVTIRTARPRTAKERQALESVAPMLEGTLRQGMASLTGLVRADVEARAAAADAAGREPDLAAGRGVRTPIATAVPR